MSSVLEVSGLGCTRGERVLFEGLDFACGNGALVVVEGANGVGKTSLLRILAGFLTPSAGTVRWQGVDIRGTTAEYRSVVGYLGHAAGVKLDLTVIENVEYAQRLKRVNSGPSADSAVERLGLSGVRDLPVRLLSAGQKRRVAIAGLLGTVTALWLLDEPLTALDASGRAIVENMLAAHVGAGGLAVVTTHVPIALPGLACQRLVINET